MESLKKEKNWLIKSSTRIMGPYTSPEILDLLKKKHISLLDEACKPAGRWNYIREHKDLESIVEKIKLFDQSHEKTLSQMTIGQTISKTENLHEIDEDAYEDHVKAFSSKNTQDLIKDIVPIKEEVVTYNTAAKPSNLTYGAYTEAEISGAAESHAGPWKLILLLLTVAMALGYFGYSFFLKTRQSQSYQTLIATALRLNSIQLYEKSYQVFKKAKAQHELELPIQAQMSLLAIALDNDSSSNRNVIEKYLLADELKDRKLLVDFNLAIGLSYVSEGDDQKAMESFQKAGSYEPFSQLILLNRSLLQLRKGDYRDSYINLKKVNSRDEFLSLLLYVKALTLIEMSRSTSAILEEIRDLAIEIPNQIQKSAMLRNELLFLNIKLQSILKNDGVTSVAIDRFLESAPESSSLIVKDPRIDWKMAGWESLDRLCVELSHIRTGHKSKLLRAHCLMEKQNTVQAQKWIDQANAEVPNDSYVLNSQIFWMTKMKRHSEALLLAKKNESRLFPAAGVVLAEICIENKDEACASAQLNKFLTNTFLAPRVYFNLAQISLQRGQTLDALQKIKQGLGTEPLYLPLIELRESLESQ